MSDRLTSELAALHRFALGFLAVYLTDQLTPGFAESPRQIRIGSDRHQLWKTRQVRPKRYPLLFAATVVGRYFDVRPAGIPPRQVWPERREGVQHVRAFLLLESHTEVHRVLIDGIGWLIAIGIHCGPLSATGFDGSPNGPGDTAVREPARAAHHKDTRSDIKVVSS